MKKLLSLLTLTVFSFSLAAQGIIEEKFSQYLDNEDVTQISVSGKLFSLASSMASLSNDEESKEFAQFASTITHFGLINVPDIKNGLSAYNNGISYITSDYDELIIIRDGDTRFTLFVDDADNYIREVVGIGLSENDLIVFSLVGEMEMEKISKYVSQANESSFKSLEKMKTFNPEELKVYPNPVKEGSTIQLDIPKGLVGGTATIFSSNGSEVDFYPLKSQKESIALSEITPGNYFIQFEKNGISMKRQIIVIK